MYPEALEQVWLRRACGALGIDDPRDALQRLEPDIERLSDLFTTGRAPGFDRYADSPRMLLAYALFFLPQTFARVAMILDECRGTGWAPTTGRALRVLDLGAGLGAAGFAAVDALRQPADLLAVDQSTESLALLREAFAAVQPALWPQATLDTRAANLLHAFRDNDDAWDLVLCGFALNEAADAENDGTAVEWLRLAIGRLAPGGLLVLCEPASDATSSRLERLRDVVAAEGRARILAPCPHHRSCPLLREGKVYCHEVRRWAPPSSLAYLNQRLARSVQFLKFSFLALAREPAPAQEGDASRARLVAPVTEQNGKLVTRGCAADGEVHTYEVLTRHLTRDERDRARAIERGTRVAWGPLKPLGNSALRADALPRESG